MFFFLIKLICHEIVIIRYPYEFSWVYRSMIDRWKISHRAAKFYGTLKKIMYLVLWYIYMGCSSKKQDNFTSVPSGNCSYRWNYHRIWLVSLEFQKPVFITVQISFCRFNFFEWNRRRFRSSISFFFFFFIRTIKKRIRR